MTRLLFPLMLLALAIIATFSQLDRQARYTPELSRWVPIPFASFSLEHSLQHSLDNGQVEQAQLAARALVAKRPIPAEHQRWLAHAMVAHGDQNGAGLTIQRAARHGWRDLGVQQSMLVLAMQAEDHEQVALHLAALWALAGDRELLRQFSPTVLEQPVSRQRFAEVMSGARWRRSFLTNGPTVLSADLFTATLSDSQKAGVTFDCKRLDKSLQRTGTANTERTEWAHKFDC